MTNSSHFYPIISLTLDSTVNNVTRLSQYDEAGVMLTIDSLNNLIFISFGCLFHINTIEYIEH